MFNPCPSDSHLGYELEQKNMSVRSYPMFFYCSYIICPLSDSYKQCSNINLIWFVFVGISYKTKHGHTFIRSNLNRLYPELQSTTRTLGNFIDTWQCNFFTFITWRCIDMSIVLLFQIRFVMNSIIQSKLYNGLTNPHNCIM